MTKHADVFVDFLLINLVKLVLNIKKIIIHSDSDMNIILNFYKIWKWLNKQTKLYLHIPNTPPKKNIYLKN